ncbi:MAG: signal peptide peptidase SppA [archaeon]
MDKPIDTLRTMDIRAKDGEKDPRITPWEEDPAPTSIRRPRGRSMRDWMVLAAAFILLLYVIGFFLSAFSSPSSPEGMVFSGNGRVAWIPIQGEIVSSGGSGTVDFYTIIDALDRASSDPGIDAIFLDIDSPGGSVVASKQIVSRIRQVDKPVVAWIGELGASGGYYIASASDYVVADADSLTGSIGVISILPNFTGLMEKIGIQVESVATGELKGGGSPYSALTEEEREIFQGLVDEAFLSFVSDVRSFRGDRLIESGFSRALDGRILSGRQALEMGLIDEVGTREEALLRIGPLAGFEGKPVLVSFIVKDFSWTDLFFSAGAQVGNGFVSAAVSDGDIPPSIQAK